MVKQRLKSPLVLVALSCALLMASGCIPVLIGGAAVGGYYLGKDDRNPTQIAADSSITAKVKSKFIADKYVDAFDINVDTHAGIVTLHGDVTNTVAREQAEKLARNVDGVQSVDNQIRIVKPVTESDKKTDENLPAEAET
jgi:hyperosmotically inducible protein